MSQYLERMKQAIMEPVSIRMQVERLVRNHKVIGPIAVIEGRDDPCFYLPEIRRVFHDRPVQRPIIARGKREVLSLLEYVRQKFGATNKLLFFVDSDHDHFLGNTADDICLYQTDYYSFENHYSSAEMLERYLTEYLALDLAEDAIQSAKDQFSVSWQSFVSAITPLMAWSLAERSIGAQIVFNNVKLGNVLNFDEDLKVIAKPNAYKIFRKACGRDNMSLNISETQRWLETLATIDPKIYIRGKFELWFFCKYLEKLLESLARVNPSVRPKNFSSEVVLRVRYCHIPDSLNSFLDNRYAAVAAIDPKT